MAAVKPKKEPKERKRYTLVDSEPKVESLPSLYRALSWYNLNKTDKDAAKILDCTPSVARRFLSLAWAKRMIARGYKFGDRSNATIATMEKDFLAYKQGAKKVVEISEDGEPVVPVKTIQERTAEKADAIIGEMQGLVDQFGMKGDASKMNAYKWMSDNGVKAAHVSRIVAFFEEQAKEVRLAAAGKDAALNEGYASYGKKGLKNLVACFDKIIEDAKKFSTNQKTQRKPRVKKAISTEKLVKGLKFLAKDDTLKIQSVQPEKIVGAQQLWVYNVKTKKLGVYKATGEAGLSVKGTTIINYDEATSIAKNVRKPDVTLTSVTTGGKVTLRNLLDGIKAKEAPMNGRINKDTVLLRVL